MINIWKEKTNQEDALGTSKEIDTSIKELRLTLEKSGKPENIFMKLTSRIMLQMSSINWRCLIMLLYNFIEKNHTKTYENLFIHCSF